MLNFCKFYQYFSALSELIWLIMVISQSDFKEEGAHKWVLQYTTPKGEDYEFLVRRTDGDIEVVIRAKTESDLTLDDWNRALRTLNSFVAKEVIAKDKELG